MHIYQMLHAWNIYLHWPQKHVGKFWYIVTKQSGQKIYGDVHGISTYIDLKNM